MEEISQGLTNLTAQCVFASGVATLTLNSGDLALVNKLPSGALGVNGFPCAAATTATLKQLVVNGSTGAETLIIDYMGGMWGTGTATTVGIVVDLKGGGDSLKIRGTKQADTFVFGATGITVNTDTFKDITYANVANFVVALSDGDDNFSGAGSTVTGGPFASAITVYGGAGNDTLRGGAGNDTLNGDDGNDTFVTGALPDGNDTMAGGAGTDTADYSARTGAVNLSIDGVANDGDIATSETDNIGTDIEVIKGGMGNDILTGSANADTIFGGPGDDTITGGLGADTLNGDAGNDTFDEGAANSGADIINGGAGTDTVSYASRTNAVTVNLDGTATSGESGENDKIAVDVENVVGGMGDDIINGSAADNVLDGGPGNDTIHGNAGNDTIRGGSSTAADATTTPPTPAGINHLFGDAGNDTFDEGSSASGMDIIVGGAGIDTVDYSGRTNAVVVVMDGTTSSGETSEGDIIGADVENLIGGAGDDTLTGNALDNQIEGRGGNDTIFGLDGDDVIDGGGQADTIDCGLGDSDVLLSVLTTDSTVSPPLVGSAINCEL